MDALSLISGFVGLLLLGQVLRARKRQRSERWGWVALFALCFTAEAWWNLAHLLFPAFPLPPPALFALRALGYLSLLLFGASVLYRSNARFLSRDDLFPIFSFLLLAIVCAWGWRVGRWDGLDAVLRHGLALPAGLLAAISTIPALSHPSRSDRVTAVLLLVAWTTFGLTAGFGTPSTFLASLGLHLGPEIVHLLSWLATASLLTAWLALWLADQQAARTSGGERLVLTWMQPIFLTLTIALGLLLARWQENFHLNSFRQQIETTVFQYRSALPLHTLASLPQTSDLEATLATQLQSINPEPDQRLLYTLILTNGRVTFGPSFGHGSAEPFSLTPLDRAVFDRGEPYSAGPNAGGGRFLTAVSPIRDPASGTVFLALGLNVSPTEWNHVVRSARRIPILASLILGLLCLVIFSRNLRARLAQHTPFLPFDALAVAAFGIILTATSAWLVADRSHTGRQADLQQTATTLALFLVNLLDKTNRDLETLARHLSGTTPTALAFEQACRNTALGPFNPAWFLLGPDARIRALNSPDPQSPSSSLHLGTQLEVPPLLPDRITTLASPQLGQLLLLPIAGQPGWAVGVLCEPYLLLKIAHGRLGPAHHEYRAALFDQQNPPEQPLAALPGYAASPPNLRTNAPVFFGNHTWKVSITPPHSPRLLPPDVVLTLLAGTAITGMTLLVVFNLKRRQRDLENEITKRTAELRSREAESRELYERLQRIASQVPGVVFQLKRAPDSTLSFPYLSEAALQAFGLPAHRLLADATLALDRIDPRDRSRFITSLEESARDMAPWREEFRITQPGRPEAWFEGSAIPQRLTDTSVVWSGVAYDVTQRKKHEEELLFRANFQQLLTDLAGSYLGAGTDGLDRTFNHLLERVGSFVGADRAYIFQFNRARRTASNTHEWVAPGISSERSRLQDIPFDLMPEVIESQLSGRQFVIPNVANLDPSPFKASLQEQKIQSLILLPLVDEGQGFGFAGFDAVRAPRPWHPHEISLLQVMASMITQMLVRRKDELALRESEDQLRRNWEFTRTLLNAIPTPVFYMDREGRFTGCNRSYLEFTGRTVESFAGKTVFDLFDIDLAEDHHARDLELLRTGQRQSFEGTMPDMLGRKREVIFNRDVFRNEKGEITGIVGSFIDISRVRKAEQEQREMERQLLHSQKLESLGVLAGGVAHDFNNILFAITGNLELARLDLPPHSPACQALDDAVLATSRAVDLTRQMLAYSGKGHFVIQDIDLNQLLIENLAIFKAAVSKNVTLEHELAPSLPPIRGDVGQIQQIIMNLITNGSEAVGSNPGTVRVSSYTADFTSSELAACRGDVIPEPGTFVVLQVTDTGAGMDPTTLSRIFEPFFSTKFTGRGLGMAAVLGILRGHNGGILIDSQVGEGTRVRILFPAAVSPSPAPPPKKPSVSDDRQLRGRILLADDEEDVRRVCTKLLQRLGLDVLAVNDGMEAVLAVEAQPFAFDLVLLDLTMPNMDGLSTLAYLSKHHPKLPVILISGYSRDEVTSNPDAHPSVGFVQKPFRIEDLHTELARVLNSTSIHS
ncbi:MAG: response regulator [Verrucomicrobiia bacterium]